MTNDFGSVVINTNSGAASFTVTNTGEATSGSITPVITGAAAADFTPTNGCTTLAGGGTCVITVVFHPATAGVKNANLVVSGSPGGSAMATLIGTGQTPGTLTISPSSLAFGNQVNGTPTAAQTFTVTNTGTVATTALTVTKAGTDPADFVKGADTCNTMTLAGGATCTIAVTFNPTSAGPKAASFVISAATGGSVNGSVTGTGLAPARLVVVPGFQDFGSVTTGTSSGNISFTVTNTGDVASSAITDSFTAPNGAEFSRLSTTCTTLAPNASCTIVVRFTPTTVGAKMSNLSVTATTGGTATASLIGAAVAPGNLAISPTPFAFPDTTVGQMSTTQVFTVTNTGGSATGALGTALGGTDPSHFTVVAGSNGCQGVVLAPAGTCTIVLSFAPTSGGLKSATLAVNHTGGSTTAAISGTGIAPALFTLAPASRDYGSVVTTTTSAPQNFVLTNVGGQTSGVPAFAINGANASEFAVNATGCPAALAPNDSCTVQVTFSPATAGAKTASLDVTGTGGPVSSALSGNGISNAALAVAPSIINFPLTLIGNSAVTQNFTVTNNGSVDTGNLTITVIPAGEYTQTNNCTDGAGPGVDFLIPGASCVVAVTFSPTTPGLRSATIQVSGAPGGTVGTAVNGNALAKLEIETPVPVTFPINMHTFANSIVDPDAPGTVQVTLRNNDSIDRAVTAAPTFGGNFTLTSAPCGTITAGGTCVVTYAYTPQTIGTHNGQVIFTATGGGAGNTAQQNFTGTSNLLTLKITDAFGAQAVGPPVDTTPTSHDFGPRAIGTSSSLRTFQVTNEGNMPTGILAVDLTGAGFQIESNNCSGVSLADNATCEIVIVYTPTAQAQQMGTITVRTSQGAPFLGGTVTATVTGTGTAPTPIAVPTAINYGLIFAGDTAVANTDRTFTVTNPNDVSTTLGITVNNGPSQYLRITGGPNDCGATLGAGLSCVVTIRFIPTLAQLGPRPQANVSVGMGTGSLSATVTLDATVRSTISLVSAPTPFTDVVLGTTPSPSQTITVRNDSPQTVTGFTITAPGPYAILSNTCSLATLMPANTAGDTCSFSLVYTPTAPAGSDPTTVTVLGGSTGSASASVVANSITAANLTLTGADVDFGSEIVGQPGSSRVYTVTNIGQQTSGVVTAALTTGTNFSITANTCTTTLGFNASCTVTVRFNPVAGGTVGDTLTASATPGGPNETLALTGFGTASGGVQVTPTAFTFANTTVGQLSATQAFTVQNTNAVSAATLTISATANFSVASTTCPGSLGAGASCLIQVQFAPGTAGALTGDLIVVPGDAFAALSGRGITPANVVNNLGATFSNPAAITINDVAAATPYPSDITVTGVAGTVSYVSVTLNNFSHIFGDDVDVALRSPDGRLMTLMSDVGAGNVNNVTLTFEDSAPGLVPALTYSTGRFQPTDRSVGQSFGAGGVEPDPYPTLGSALRPAPLGTATLASAFNGAPANGTWSLFVVDDTGGGTGAFAGGWSITLNTVAFGDQAINTTSGTRTIVFSNTGETTAAPLTAAQTGPDGSHFVITNGCAGVALTPVGTPGSTCNVVAAFAPTTTGAKTTQLDFTGPVTTTIVFTGTGVNAAMLSISPSVLQDDGNRVIGDADTASTVFTISNLIGSATTNPIVFTLSDPANYTFDTGAATTCLLNGNQTLPAGGSCTVGVFFNPTQLGVRAGNLVAASNNTVMGLMTGTGTEAIVFVPGSSDSLAWGNATIGTAPAARTYTFVNASDVSTTLVQTTLLNTAGTDFSVVADTCGGVNLSPAQTCTVTIRFVPAGTTTGARTATLTEQTTVTGTTTTAAIMLTGAAQ